MRTFVTMVGLKPQDRILDLGGHPDIWASVEIPLNITILNLPGQIVEREILQHSFTYVEGDACDVADPQAGDFDVVYSNSVIEHVGPEDRQRSFAKQVLKFNARYWVQTPSKWFPIEAHCGMPFWWFYPSSLRDWFIGRWRPKLPAWTEMVEETRVLERNFIQELFPGAEIHTEKLLGIPKSYIAYSRVKSSENS